MILKGVHKDVLLAGGIVITVDSELTPLGQNATYTCPSDTNFVVDVPGLGNLDTIVLDDQDTLATREIFVVSSSSDAMLLVLATAENNGTTVKCQRLVFPDIKNSDTLTLVVIGKCACHG